MKYISPMYKAVKAQSDDVITASYTANNCTVNNNATPTFTVPGTEEQPTRVTQVSGLLNSLIRPN